MSESSSYTFKSTIYKVKEKEQNTRKDWLQGLGAAGALCLFSILFCTLIMMRFP